MQRLRAVPLVLLIALAACKNTTGPVARSLVGTWNSAGFAGAQITMTLTEAARQVNGAGNWQDPASVAAFQVNGTHAGQTVSLLLLSRGWDADLNFQGVFTSADTLSGTLTGGPFRSQPITFGRPRGD